MRRSAKRIKAYHIVEKMFRCQKEIEQAVLEARSKKNTHTRDGGSGHAYISDPTAREAIANIMPLNRVDINDGYTVYEPERWIQLIHQVYDELAEDDRRIVQMFYSGVSAVRVSLECHVYRSTVYRIRCDCMHMATELACQYGLVRVN